MVGQAHPPVVEGSKLMELTLDQAFALALERNLDLKAARMNPQSVDYQLQAARAAFTPQFTASYSYRDAKSASNNTLEGFANISNTTQGYNGGLSQWQLPWYGASFSATVNNQRQATNDVTRRVNPSFTSGLSVTGQMPLLANFKMDNTRNQLRTLADFKADCGHQPAVVDREHEEQRSDGLLVAAGGDRADRDHPPGVGPRQEVLRRQPSKSRNRDNGAHRHHAVRRLAGAGRTVVPGRADWVAHV